LNPPNPPSRYATEPDRSITTCRDRSIRLPTCLAGQAECRKRPGLQQVANFFTILIVLLVIYFNFRTCLTLFLTSFKIGKWNLINVIEFIINYGEFRLHKFPLKQIRKLMWCECYSLKWSITASVSYGIISFEFPFGWFQVQVRTVPQKCQHLYSIRRYWKYFPPADSSGNNVLNAPNLSLFRMCSLTHILCLSFHFGICHGISHHTFSTATAAQVTCNNAILEQVKSFRYLGSIITDTCDCRTEITARLGMASLGPLPGH